MASLSRLTYPDGKVARLFHRWMFFPRATHYQQFCVRLVELAMELPVRSYHDGCQAAHPKVRHCDELRSVDLEPWIVAVLQENVLAGMVLIDAVDYVMSYTFITREIQGEESSLQLRPRPTDQEVCDIAKLAVDRLTDQASEQAHELAQT